MVDSTRYTARGVGLVMAFAWVAAGQTFSHQAHLGKAGMGCMDCHAGAAASASAADRLLPDEEICLRCHDSAVVPRGSAVRLDLRFNHKLHLGMGNLAPVLIAAIDGKTYLGPAADVRPHLNTKDPCRVCHRGLEQAGRATAANLPRMADCLVCHQPIDAPFTCRKCHSGDAAHLKPASHTPEYMDLHSGKKIPLDKPSCRVCHGVEFRCLGCH